MSYAGIVVCDPPLRRVKVRDDGLFKGRSFIVPIKSPGLGYIDFLPEDAQAQTGDGPTRTSLTEDLSFYLMNYSHTEGVNWDTPDVVLLFARKIVASHYARLFDYLRKTIIKYQDFMRRQVDFKSLSLEKVETNWSDTQTLVRRLNELFVDLEEILVSLGIPLERPNPQGISSWQDVDADFQMLYHTSGYARRWAEEMNSAMTGLTGIAGNRQGLREQGRARHLTGLGLVFVPLTYIATLFSMSTDVAPGGGRFWLYFAIAIPSVLVVLVAYQSATWVERYFGGRSSDIGSAA